MRICIRKLLADPIAQALRPSGPDGKDDRCRLESYGIHRPICLVADRSGSD